MLRKTLVACCLLWMLGGCGRHDDATGHADGAASEDASLPKPAPTGGSVTGMPARPGPGQIGAPRADAPMTDTVSPIGESSDATVAGDVASDNADVPQADGDAQMPAEPTPADAIAVLRDYYRAIDSQDYVHAWSLWSDGGRSSGQSPQQFADGFANTAHVTVETGAPGSVGAAAGSRFIEIPVTVDAVTRDGGTQHYSGTYTLRRAVVDGAAPEQRAWRIASASLHAAAP